MINDRPTPSAPPARSPAQHIAAGLARIGLALKSQAWQQGWADDLTPTQGQILADVATHPARTLGAVAEALGIRPSTASEAVAVLEAKGLLTKERDLGDGRRLALALTSTGRTAAERVARWPDFLTTVVEELEPAEQGVLLRLLQRLIRALQERGEIPVASMCVTCRYFRPHVHDNPAAPHHCAYVNAPIGDRDLRLDCAEHRSASPEEASRNWERFIGASAGAL
ncbi:MAG TPA: MarR family winged helix-turn-helix transcriptional regulator [Thermoanaerobaculia bacterium]|nr:MarR family winged helix-turn-helix transcriptional regulator [Thermoanaerobaculia bacterium]